MIVCFCIVYFDNFSFYLIFCLKNFIHYYFLIFFLLSQYLKFLGVLIILFVCVCVFWVSTLIHFMRWTIFIFFYIFCFFFFLFPWRSLLYPELWKYFYIVVLTCGHVVGYLWFYYLGQVLTLISYLGLSAPCR